ncbi:unnamed protein product [Meganyctiphanes norvegica]|uniref:Uncharacterized protein n=1 Tax=Meganyctiphanes norvegica TaxID=48144 RepID=A0AAV2RWP0_MEGNR
MVEQDHEPGAHELCENLREKIKRANLSRHQIENLIPPSLAKRDHHNIPPYVPGSYRKQCEETRKRLERLEGQCLPKHVYKKEQEKYLNEFYDLKAKGKLSHLSPEMLKKLEEEIKAAAADPKKHAELEEFLSSLNKQTAIPEQQSKDKGDGVPTENVNSSSHRSHSANDTSSSQVDHSANRKKKPSIVKVELDDGSHVECVAILSPGSLCLTALPTEKKEPKEKKGPVNVPSRNVKEILDACNMITEYIQHESDLTKYLQEVEKLEKTLKHRV